MRNFRVRLVIALFSVVATIAVVYFGAGLWLADNHATGKAAAAESDLRIKLVLLSVTFTWFISCAVYFIYRIVGAGRASDELPVVPLRRIFFLFGTSLIFFVLFNWGKDVSVYLQQHVEREHASEAAVYFSALAVLLAAVGLVFLYERVVGGDFAACAAYGSMLYCWWLFCCIIQLIPRSSALPSMVSNALFSVAFGSLIAGPDILLIARRGRVDA